MKYTFEISVSGCETECAHCYVGGGRAAAVSFGDYVKAIAKLSGILDKLEGEIHVTLGNEIFTHPRISDIIYATRELIPDYYSYRGLSGFIPTTGISLVNRKDRRELLESVKRADCSGFMLTLHGDREHHNTITQNKLSFDAVKACAKWLCGEGLDIKFNLMLSKFLIADWQKIHEFIADFPGAEKKLTIPLYLPTDRLRKFQRYRAEYDDCARLSGKLENIGIKEENLFDNCERNIYAKVNDCVCFDYAEEENKLPEWTFFNITQAFDVFYGNAGLHTRRLGNLLYDAPDELAQKMITLPANYDWSAYYDTDKLPPIESVLRDIKPLNTNFVYSSIHDCIYSWLDGMNVPNIIL